MVRPVCVAMVNSAGVWKLANWYYLRAMFLGMMWNANALRRGIALLSLFVPCERLPKCGYEANKVGEPLDSSFCSEALTPIGRANMVYGI